MNPRPDPRLDPDRLTELTSYGGLHRARCRRFVPADVGELRELFRRAKAEGHRVTLRGGGLAFDAQALNDDWVISLERFGGLRVEPEAARVTVGPAESWGAIVDATLAHDLLLPILATTSHATAGGTLASNGLGRFSHLHGKEADWVERFRLLTPDGEILECSRSSNADLFRAVLGGHGYLGAVVEATYRLQHIGKARRSRHRIHKLRTFEALAGEMLLRPGAEPEEIASGLVIPDGGERSLLCFVRLVETEGRHRFPGLAPGGPWRYPLEWGMRFASVGRLMWRIAFEALFREGVGYHDPLRDFLFFMDGNVRAKALGVRLGLPMCAVQQSFALPAPPGPTHVRGQAVVAFLRSINATLARHRVASVFFDVLLVPQEKDSLLSSTRDFEGFMVSVAFEESAPPVLARIRACMEELSERCLELGGRVHLTKNVYARPEVLEAMYGRALDAFFEQKARVDTGGVLCNGFLERIFPSRVAAMRKGTSVTANG